MNTANKIEVVSKEDLLMAFDMVDEYAVDFGKDPINDTVTAYFEDGSEIVFTQVNSTNASAKFLSFK